MNDESFVGFVVNNASRYDIETLEKIIHSLNDNIAGRRWGKPSGLKVGSNIEAILFEAPNFVQYGTVVRMSPKGCKIESPRSSFTWPIWYAKHSIRILDEPEWNRIWAALERGDEEYEAKRQAEFAESAADREDAINNRSKAQKKAVTMGALHGSVQVFRGAFVHAYRPDWDNHEYGVVVDFSAKKIVLSDPGDGFERSITVSKHVIDLLSEGQWAIVDAELRRRAQEYDAAKAAGKEQSLPDYSSVEIELT